MVGHDLSQERARPPLLIFNFANLFLDNETLFLDDLPDFLSHSTIPLDQNMTLRQLLMSSTHT